MPVPDLGALFAGWRGLAYFWLLVVAVLAAGGVTLQILGPPAGQHREAATTTPPSGTSPGLAQVAPQPAKPAQPEQQAKQAQQAAPVPAAQRPGRSAPGPIADPDPALLEPVPGSTSDLLPRIADDGRMPMQVYAAGFDTSSRRPRVGVLLAGIGLSQSDSTSAIHSLPGGITLAFSPYAQNPAKLLADARLSEHEFLLSIPMEPQGFSLNDPGPEALMTNLSVEQDRTRLLWALSRIRGYVGATAALGTGLLGERFASLPEEFQPVLSELAQRGLLYVDPRVGAARLPMVWSRTVDLVLDEPDAATAIDDKLVQLSNLARSKGNALGLATAPRPITIQRIAAWADGLTADGLALAPVSALVRPPPKGTGP
ncbi:MAG TPA: divergent polysaccharide deacetylase family protein [Acetobacteraceae bacterium]|jgi:polysaccharide deacetylase 2 family uncharacterized protein YibQ|nr:divergent polysaccharide deacetylase family protein [Acetobacteraceae bacterium]